jgi:hypothetical protein
VPSEARGLHIVRITFDTGPLAGKITGSSPLRVAEK